MVTRRRFVQLVAFIAASRLSRVVTAAEPAQAEEEQSVMRLKQMVAAIKPAFDAFVPTDWSKRHPEEKPQSLESFIASQPNRPNATRKRLYVQPIGTLPKSHAEALTATNEMLAATFGLPVTVLPTLSLDRIPASARRVHPSWGVPQILSTYILDEVLKPQRPSDAVAVLGITGSDLWPGKAWNFVFGQASLSERVGIWSLHRYGDPLTDEAARKLFLHRTLKVAVHETGHMFGIRHCVHFRCGMNGSNSLDETDEAPLALCPQCIAKLCWSCRRDPADWFKAVAEAGRKHDLADQTVWDDCLALLKR